MPELPEVETVCRGLQTQLPGDVIRQVEVLRRDSIGYPDVEEFCKRLVGHRFVGVSRRGKYILIDLDKNGGLAVHLRMSGRLIVGQAKDRKGSFLRVRILLASGRELQYEDMRVFGRLWYKPSDKRFDQVIPTLAELGVEPLSGLTGASLKNIFSKRKQAIKSALMDQRLLAGIGNIYADESLFQARIHPLRAAGDLKVDELDRLALEIPRVLRKAIENRGTTLRDYTDSEGVNGNYQNRSWVYGRTGEKCRVCREQIQRLKIAGRSSHFCLICQPAKKVRKKSR